MIKNIIMVVIFFVFAGLSNNTVGNKSDNIISRDTITTTSKLIPIVEHKIIYSNVVGTVYHAVPEQTDSTPLITADGSKIDTARVNNLRWIAVSRDLINLHTKRYNFNGKLKFNDTVWIAYDSIGVRAFAIKNKLSVKRTEALIKKYEKIKGYWIVKDTMGDYYWKPQEIDPTRLTTEMVASKQYKVEKGKVFKKSYQRNWIDFLQHPKTGMLHYWNKNIIITKKTVVGHKINSTVQDELKVNG